MEVHQVRSHAKEKHFKHYLFEFLMLFLAVTAGFFMENQRDHYIEKQREKQFIRSLAEDLKKDIRELDKKINFRKVRRVQIDSIISILHLPDPDQSGNQLYYFARYLPRAYRFEFNEGTLQQLKSSGNLRLIEDQSVVDSILALDHSIHNIEWIESREEQNVLRVFPLLIKLFDPDVFNSMNVLAAEFTRPPGNPHLLTKDKDVIREFLGVIHFIRTSNDAALGYYIDQNNHTQYALSFVEKEYHLEQ